jgi:hypothetical protein
MTMSDDFLSKLREEPRREFATQLGARLREIDEDERERKAAPPLRRRPLLAASFAVALAAAALSLPAVRAAARDFLDLFRVQRFTAVAVDPERVARLEQSGLDLKTLVGPSLEILQPAVKPEAVADAAEAAAQAGIELRAPTRIPDRATPVDIKVARPGSFRVRMDVEKLRSLADLLGVEPSDVPSSWDGATVEVHTSPIVGMSYRRDDANFVFFQARGPEVTLPAGVDLVQLGELGLRLAGMSKGEARLFARTIDWRSTLLVPIPAQGGNFREVDIRGRKGLLVSSQKPTRTPEGTVKPGRWSAVVLWADGERVYAAVGPGHGFEVLEMAQSVE